MTVYSYTPGDLPVPIDEEVWGYEDPDFEEHEAVAAEARRETEMEADIVVIREQPGHDGDIHVDDFEEREAVIEAALDRVERDMATHEHRAYESPSEREIILLAARAGIEAVLDLQDEDARVAAEIAAEAAQDEEPPF